MNHFLLTICLLAITANLCNAKTLKDIPVKVLSPLSSALNDVNIDLIEHGRIHRSKFNLNRRAIDDDYTLSENNFYNGDNSGENELDSDIDTSVFASSGDMGEALRQMWEYFAKRVKRLERRVSHVQKQTSEILTRLSAVDCSSLKKGSQSGVHTLYLDHHGTHSVQAHCDQDTDGGGWTVILRRVAHEVAEDATNFRRDLRDYKVGFGDPTADFWIGLENIYIWTSFQDYQLRINMEDFNGDTAFAHYDTFYIESEKKGYRLHVSGYRGNAGDALTNENNRDNFTADGMTFSTHDEDRDTSREINCSQHWDVGGWWFNRCSWANLMGRYRLPGTGNGIGINWHKWRKNEYIKAATMMIRPVP